MWVSPKGRRSQEAQHQLQVELCTKRCNVVAVKKSVTADICKKTKTKNAGRNRLHDDSIYARCYIGLLLHADWRFNLGALSFLVGGGNRAFLLFTKRSGFHASGPCECMTGLSR